MPPAAPVIAAVVGVVGAGVGIASANRASRSQRIAADAARRQKANQARRSRMQALRQAQQRRALMRTEGEARGMFGGSALAGGLGGVSSSLGSALGYSTQQGALSNIIGVESSRASRYSGLSQMGFGMMNLGLKYGGAEGLKGMFGSQPSPSFANATGAALEEY